MRKFLLLLVSLPIILFLYGHFIESEMLLMETVDIHNDALHTVLGEQVVLQISDPHFENKGDAMRRRLQRKIKQLQPDLIFLTGDYVEWFPERHSFDEAARFLGDVSKDNTVYAVFGDADISKSYDFSKYLSSNAQEKITVNWLDENPDTLIINGMPLQLMGLNPFQSIHPPGRIFDYLGEGIPTILLAHSSMVYNKINRQSDILVLSGDTHGGQIYLPIFIWKLLHRKPDPKHMYGHFRDHNKQLFVNDGIGTSKLDVRIGVPPKLTRLQFLPTQ